MNSRSQQWPESILKPLVSGGAVLDDVAASPAGRRNRVVNFCVALTLAVIAAVAGTPTAQAYSVPWVPPSGGDQAVFGEVVSGGVTSDIGWIEIHPAFDPNVEIQTHRWMCGIVEDAAGLPGLRLCGGLSQAHWEDVNSAARRTVQCVDPSRTPGPYGTTNNRKTGDWYERSFPETFWGPCGASGLQISVTGERKAGTNIGLDGFTAIIYPPGEVTVTCASDTAVSVVPGRGYGSVSVSCPEGSTPIGASVNDRSYTVPGSGSKPVLAGACARGECQPTPKVGGYSCDPTMAMGTDPDWCRKAGNGGSLPPDATCEWKHPTLGVIVLPLSDCASWLEGVVGPPVAEPEEHDSGVIVEWLQRILDAINGVRSAVNGVREAVQGARVDIVEAIEGIDVGGGGSGPGEQSGVSVCGREAVTTWYNPAEWAYDAIACAVVPADLGGSLQAGFSLLFDDPGSGFSRAEEWGEVFYPISDAFAGLDSEVCSCEGWIMDWPIVGEIEVGNSCTGIALGLADVSRAATGTLIVVGGLGACVRIVAAAFGFVALVGPAVRSEVKDASASWQVYSPHMKYHDGERYL